MDQPGQVRHGIGRNAVTREKKKVNVSFRKRATISLCLRGEGDKKSDKKEELIKGLAEDRERRK